VNTMCKKNTTVLDVIAFRVNERVRTRIATDNKILEQMRSSCWAAVYASIQFRGITNANF
jgi:hypothetical protein